MKTTRQNLIAWSLTQGCEVSFVANLIYANHGVRVHKRLLGLYKLVRRGFEVRCAPFSTDTLLVSGYQAPFASLEDPDALIDGVVGRQLEASL